MSPWDVRVGSPVLGPTRWTSQMTTGTNPKNITGIYDWYDPLLVLEALPRLLADDPRTVVVFVDHPHPELTPLTAAARTRDLARDRGWLGREVRFESWRAYDRRFDLAQVSDLAVVTHRPGLETDLSLRTRLVDLLWLGLPVVVTEGGTMAQVVRRTGAGETVPAGDAEALAAARTGLAGVRQDAAMMLHDEHRDAT